MPDFKPGEYVVYQNGDRFELGQIKRVTRDGAFVWYHDGDTAARTPFDCMHKLMNGYVIKATTLGGNRPIFIPTDGEEVETNLYDVEEVHDNCTVQILRNSITGEQSIGWWPNRRVPNA